MSRSLPESPFSVSLPLPPSSVSSPEPPFKRSLPVPPLSVSLPEPPLRVSLPAPPSRISSPAPPLRLSAPLVPVTVVPLLLVAIECPPPGADCAHWVGSYGVALGGPSDSWYPRTLVLVGALGAEPVTVHHCVTQLTRDCTLKRMRTSASQSNATA